MTKRCARKTAIRNQEIAHLLENIASLLEIKGESSFRVRAYREAARHIDGMPEDIIAMRQEGRLRDIHGVGESLAAKIEEYLSTGAVAYYEELKSQVAPGLGDLLEVPGLGPRRAKLIYDHLGITSLSELATAAAEHRLREVPGIREKTEEKILRELGRVQQRSHRALLGMVLPVAEEAVAALRAHRCCSRIDMAGSIRRMKETIGDIDLLVASDEPDEVMDAFVSMPLVREILLKGATKSSVLTRDNVQIDLRVLRPDEYGAGLQYFTGSKEHNVALRELAIGKGLKLSEYGVFDESGKRVAGQGEEEVYRVLGLDWIPPELREHRGELLAAARGQLPRLITDRDIRGDLHMHTDWSDGVDSLAAMVDAARARGYEYVAVTDHSVGLGIARGLSPERVSEQRAMIDQLNAKLAPFRILHGIEVEIKRDGTLDYGEEVLANFDIVTASVHSGFDQPIEQMTERMLRAARHPLVDVINHPRGRLIDKRAGYAVDLERVIREAVVAGTAVEINSQPDRLDLDDVWARRAKDLGAMLTISSDAHSVVSLGFLRYGVATARRAWLEPSNVLNTLTLDNLLIRLHLRRRAA